MLSHICIGINDHAGALRFYAPLLAELGLVQKFSDEARGWTGWVRPDAPRPLLLVGRPDDCGAATPGNGQMVALLAVTRERVRRVHALALAGGGTCEGPPGLRPHYHPDYYGAYFRDPEGNKLCVCCHAPQELA